MATKDYINGGLTAYHKTLQCKLKPPQNTAKHLKLEIWGRAQLEAARHPKSNWNYNLGGLWGA